MSLAPKMMGQEEHGVSASGLFSLILGEHGRGHGTLLHKDFLFPSVEEGAQGKGGDSCH